MAEILLVDDEANARLVMSLNLQQRGHSVEECASAATAVALLAQRDFDVVVTDLRMEQADSGLEVVQAMRRYHPDGRVLLLTAYASADTAVHAMKLGAFDYLTKPVSAEELAQAIERALSDKLGEASEGREAEASPEVEAAAALLIGDSLVMQRVRDRLLRAAQRDFAVLITGESGTGKELSARVVHQASARKEAPFVPVNCAAIPEGLFESELFGYRKGAFTGAESDRQGLIESAHGGTLFLDEIGEMPLMIQVKMLRVLQDHMVRRVGEQQERKVDVRIIAATNRDLDVEVKQGAFREDLFYRLNVVPIHLPPLRQRREDIPQLVAAILQRIGGGEELEFPPQLLRRISELPLLGNVRELENLLQRLLAFSDGDRLDGAQIDEVYGMSGDASDCSWDAFKRSGVSLDHWLARIESALLRQALDEKGGNATKAAKLLGISFRSMRYRLQKLGMQ